MVAADDGAGAPPCRDGHVGVVHMKALHRWRYSCAQPLISHVARHMDTENHGSARLAGGERPCSFL